MSSEWYTSAMKKKQPISAGRNSIGLKFAALMFGGTLAGGGLTFGLLNPGGELANSGTGDTPPPVTQAAAVPLSPAGQRGNELDLEPGVDLCDSMRKFRRSIRHTEPLPSSPRELVYVPSTPSEEKPFTAPQPERPTQAASKPNCAEIEQLIKCLEGPAALRERMDVLRRLATLLEPNDDQSLRRLSDVTKSCSDPVLQHELRALFSILARKDTSPQNGSEAVQR